MNYYSSTYTKELIYSDCNIDEMTKNQSDQEIHAPQSHTANQPSAVGNVSDYKCISDCIFRGHEFGPGLSNTFVKIDNE